MAEPVLTRANILDTVKAIVTQDRAATHGAPEDLFPMIAASWSAKLGIPVSASQVCLLLADMKACRAWVNPGHDDNWYDGCGYFACGGEVVRC
jgi:hypothetical protein